MDAALTILIALAVLATLGVLTSGIVSMIRGGEFNRKHGNKLMRTRVIMQAVAIVLIGLFMLLVGR